MKSLKITTREGDKLREKIKVLDRRIGAHKHLVDTPFNTQELVSKQAKRLTVISTLSEMIHAKAEGIEAALSSVNGQAKAHTISTYAEVWTVADRAEALLDTRGVSKKNRVGTTVVYNTSGPSAKAYKYGAISTTIHLKRVADGWRLVGVNRYTAWPQSPETFNLTISPEAADNISRAAFDCITVRLAVELAA